MDQRSGSRFSYQPSPHHAVHQECSYHALGTTQSWITWFLVPAKGLRYITGIPLADLSSRCPLQKLISTNQSIDVYTPIANEDSVLVGCPTDFETGNQDGIVGPSSCLNLKNNASQSWYLVDPVTDMSTLPKGCAVVANSIPIPYTYDKNGQRYDTPFFYKSLFKEKAYKKINFGETSFNWSLNNITRACQRCEQEGQHCGFSSNRRQAFCQHPGSHVILIAATMSVGTSVVLLATALYLSLKKDIVKPYI